MTIPTVFVTPEFQNALSRLNINLIEPKAYDKIREIIGVEDIAFSIAIDQLIRSHFEIQDLGETSFLFSSLVQETTKGIEVDNHIKPLINSTSFKETVLCYLRGSEENQNIMGNESKFNLSTLNGVLVVGVQHGFYQTLSDEDSVKEFYRNCLELCQSTIPGVDLNNSNLFGKFVKLSIS